MVKKRNNLLNQDVFQSLLSWKAFPLLRKYITRFDEIKPRKFSRHSVAIQKKLRQSIIRAREVGLLPYIK